MRGSLSVIFIIALASYVVTLVSFKRPEKIDARILAVGDVDHTVDYSNILPGDYLGPESCAECHEEKYELWKSHPHSRMNRLPSETSIQGDFQNSVLKLPTGEVHFNRNQSGDYQMEVFKDGRRRRLYKVTRTIGSRYMQAYIGQQIEGPEPADHDIYLEHRLPFAYWFKFQRWIPRVYLNAYGDEVLADGVPIDEAIDGTPRVDTYSSSCMNCHNTFPYAYRIYHENLVGFPDATVAAEIDELSKAISDEIKVEPTIKSFMTINERLDPDKHLVTMGISCESCHFGGREHAQREREIKFLPTSRLTRISADDPRRRPTGKTDNAITIRGICTQCHSGNTHLFPTGGGKGNSHEGLDLLSGACATKLSCIDCHEPHTGTAQPSGGPDLARHVDVCAKCHTDYAEPKFAISHTGHAAGTVNCLDCHMPRYTRGIDSLIRTHRISLPVEPEMVSSGMANACNACHLDKSVRWTLNEHQRMWGKQIKPNTEWSSFDKLDEPAGTMWLASKDSHMRLLATGWLASSRWASERIDDIAESLNDSEPVNRIFASLAISKVLNQKPGDPIQVDITAAPDVRRRQLQSWLLEFGSE